VPGSKLYTPFDSASKNPRQGTVMSAPPPPANSGSSDEVPNTFILKIPAIDFRGRALFSFFRITTPSSATFRAVARLLVLASALVRVIPDSDQVNFQVTCF